MLDQPSSAAPGAKDAVESSHSVEKFCCSRWSVTGPPDHSTAGAAARGATVEL